MIEDATNLTNATNITNLTSNAYTIVSWILQWGGWLVGGIGIPSGVVIMFKYFAVVFRDVKLIKQGNEYTCEYTESSWQNCSIAKVVIWLFPPYRDYKKAIRDYEICVDSLNTKISQIDYVNIGLPNYESGKGKPQEYVRLTYIRRAIIDNVTSEKYQKMNFLIKHNRLYGAAGWELAKSDSEEKLKTLRDSLKQVVARDEVKEIGTKIIGAEKEMREMERVFKKKLAKIVDYVRRWDSIFSFRRASSPNDDEEVVIRR